MKRLLRPALIGIFLNVMGMVPTTDTASARAALVATAAGQGTLSRIADEIQRGPNPNVEAPTLGGKQFWRDALVHAGWRIQCNVVTGLCRLLDPDDTRHAWGSYTATRAHFETIRTTRGLVPPSRHLVLLVHGIGGSTRTFRKMQTELRKAGFDAVAISYPSTRDTIEVHADALATLLKRTSGSDKVSFVTHSMGGLVVRTLLAREDWREELTVDRFVMIAPPNKGSAVARMVTDVPLYEVVFGEAGQQLVPEAAQKIPVPDMPFAMIAGGRGDGAGYNPFLEGDDDGTVAVSETFLDGTTERLRVRAIHAFVSSRPETIAATINYLTSGFLTPRTDAAAPDDK